MASDKETRQDAEGAGRAGDEGRQTGVGRWCPTKEVEERAERIVQCTFGERGRGGRNDERNWDKWGEEAGRKQ